MTRGLVHRILTPSFVDGPGSRMAIFLQGCNLRCRYCHNPETWTACDGCGTCVSACPEKALGLEQGRIRHDSARCRNCEHCLEACPRGSSPQCFEMESADLVARTLHEALFLDGLTFSGGECSLQSRFVAEVAVAVKSQSRLTVLADTNGEMDGGIFDCLAETTDGFLFDLKAADPRVHAELTGSSNVRILENLAKAAALDRLVEVRTVVVPGFTDTPEEIEAIAELVKGLGPNIPLRLAPFRLLGVRTKGLSEPTRAEFEALADRAETILGPDRLRIQGLRNRSRNA